MTIWTTPQLNELLLDNTRPVKLLPQQELKDRFLITSAPGDAALLLLEPDSPAFLDTTRTEGLGPVIFVAPDPITIIQNLTGFNAIIVDLKTMGLTQGRNIVSLVLSLAAKKPGLGEADSPSESTSALKPKREDIEDAPMIKGMLSYLILHALPVIAAFEIQEEGKPVTARGICNVKELRNDVLVLHQFRQEHLLKELRQGGSIKLGFSYKQKAFEAVVTIQKKGDHEIAAAIPSKLFSSRDMRIQPHPLSPPGLSVIFPNAPTTKCKVVDIGTHGIGFTSDRNLPIDRLCMFTLVLPEPETIVNTQGTIRFKKETRGDFTYGAEIQPHAWDEEEIAKYVMKREFEIINLLRSR